MAAGTGGMMAIRLEAAEKPRQAVLLTQGKRAKVIAGGTLVAAELNYGRLGADTLDQLGLDKISLAADKVTIGAMVTMAQIGNEKRLTLLHPVARSIGGPAVRAMATAGGNLFAPSPYGDLTAALLALGATVTLAQGSGTKTVEIEDFLQHRNKLAPSVVTAIAFLRPTAGRFHYRKVIRRRPVSAAVVTIAAVLPVKRGRIAGARIVYGAMAETAMRARAVEAALEGKALDEAAITAAANVAIEGTAPQDDAYASAWYRREVLAIHLKRLLHEARG
jgi:CO/xanthine dehydrogenase FAD-binding subunit